MVLVGTWWVWLSDVTAIVPADDDMVHGFDMRKRSGKSAVIIRDSRPVFNDREPQQLLNDIVRAK